MTHRLYLTLPLGTARNPILKQGTHWEQVGSVEQGDVFKTKDQIVKVEASNIYEAYVVLCSNAVVGFYLPVERTFTAVKPPKAIEIQRP